MPKRKGGHGKRGGPGKKAKKEGGNSQQEEEGKRGTYVSATFEPNEEYISYYQEQGIIKAEDWKAFMDTLKTELPVTFRISTINGFHHKILQRLKTSTSGFDGSVKLEGKTFEPPKPLPWYPDEMGWYVNASKRTLKQIPELKAFRKFIIEHFDEGNINRQEAVSMLPPLLLDVKSHHYVLDMCASPGSKTMQLLEGLHANLPADKMPTGLVIANGTGFSLSTRRHTSHVCM